MGRRQFDIVIVGKCALFREGLTRLLDRTDFHVVASGPRLQDLDMDSMTAHQPVLAVIESGSDPGSALEQIEAFRRHQPTACTAVLADCYSPKDTISLVEAGANALFARSVTRDAFVKALELVLLGETFIPSTLLPLLLTGSDQAKQFRTLAATQTVGNETLCSLPNDVPRLSAREMCILRCILEGASNKTIARRMEVAEATIKAHVKAILRKTRVHNRTQAAIWAMKHETDFPPTVETSNHSPLMHNGHEDQGEQRPDVDSSEGNNVVLHQVGDTIAAAHIEKIAGGR